ncbi:NAD(P)H-dependent glycerol-3-phosphate dehydrogenase [Qingshengfaniella alkalisoli]|uniref:Glycerol-3-phosphate dehydrogenase [NAD(P)+] n=1 Tax=Qingshengfaniella alkalisoli TaxID=2599296 RepID=A0A5B8IYB8_9RHOB|nr:NAD(P)H-dependent glycerol-3-phosphate dehydrogenase [Qingshengfaniella alkalisoli]QDY69648.1 NAD(P)-dependent glycerol-3-phosphate dehydrogenase [Qingshengfaniella alkalisoli]
MTESDNHPSAIEQLTILGAGAWGTALAAISRRAGQRVTLWGRDAEILADIKHVQKNPRFLPDIELPAGIETTTDPWQACKSTQAVLVVIPSRSLRQVCQTFAPHLPTGIPIVLCCKGIEQGSGLLMSEVAQQELPNHPIGALSGPTFATEAARGYPTAATIALPFSEQDRRYPANSDASRLARALSNDGFRPYVSDDLVGVEIGGAVKNVIAIACGIMTGAGFAENTRAVLITRGLEEMKRLAQALGGRRETLSGLSGMGDLTLTCSSQTSRNMSLGFQLGQGRSRVDCFDGRDVVVEGEVNAVSVTDLARQLGVEMPICETVNAVLHGDAPLKESFVKLWNRPLKSESQSLPISLE